MRAVEILAAFLLLAPAAGAGAKPGAVVLEHHGGWESGYGSTWYSVVGKLKNTTGRPVRYVKLRVELLDTKGKRVASTETYNESAEALAVPEVDGKALLAAGKLKTIPADGEERFRAAFLKDETPPFVDYRVTVLEAPGLP